MKKFLLILLFPAFAVGQDLSTGSAQLFIGASTAQRLTIATGTNAVTATGSGGVLYLNDVAVGGGTGTANMLIAGGTLGSGVILTDGTGTANAITITGSQGFVTITGSQGSHVIPLLGHRNPGQFLSDSFQTGGEGVLGQYNAYTADGSTSLIIRPTVITLSTGTVQNVTTLTTSGWLTTGGTATNLTLASGTTALLGSIVGGTSTSISTGTASFTGNVTTTSTTNGTVVITGGLGVSGAIRTGGIVYVGNNSTALYASTSSILDINQSAAASSVRLYGQSGITLRNATNDPSFTATGSGGIMGFGTAASFNHGGLVVTGTPSMAATGSSGVLINVAVGTSATTAGWRLGIGTDGSLQAIGTAGVLKQLAP